MHVAALVTHAFAASVSTLAVCQLQDAINAFALGIINGNGANFLGQF